MTNAEKMNMQKKYTIQRTVSGIVAVILVLLVFCLFVQNSKQHAISLSEQSLKDATMRNASYIQDMLSNGESEIILLSNLYEEMLQDSEIDVESLRKLADESSFDYVGFANLEGLDINSEGDSADVSDREWFQQGMEENTGVDVAFHSAVVNENTMVFYTPLYLEDELVGVLIGRYKENKISEIIDSTFFGKKSETFLCLEDGTLIARGTGDVKDDINIEDSGSSIFDADILGGFLTEDEEEGLKAALLAGEEYEFQYSSDEGTEIAYAMPLEDKDWMLIETYPSEVISSMVRQSNEAGIALLISLIAIFILYFILVQMQNIAHRKQLIAENRDKAYVVNGIDHLFISFYLLDLEKETYRYLEGEQQECVKDSETGDYDIMQKGILESIYEEEEQDKLKDEFSVETLRNNLTDMPYLRYEYRAKRDNTKWNSIQFICLERDEGVPSKVLLAYSDVTNAKEDEIKSYEALKEAYQAVEDANRAKSDFLSSMSHDIRTPMNAIVGMTSIAQMNIENRARVSDCLNKITVSSQHLLGLINEVLDMSKIESGKMNFVEEEFNLSDVVENIVTMFLTQTKSKNQQFYADIVDVSHEDVIGDSMRLQQVFVNILGNSVKFTPEGGRIGFSICEKESYMQDYGCYVITFKDTGIGMDEKFMTKIFEPFSRAKDSRTNKVEGTGLGMPIVKNLVQMMSGEIQVESKVNEGTTFTVTVHLRLNHHKSDDLTGLENFSVLVADDEKTACESACSLLNEMGIEADAVLNGRDAVDKLVAAHREGKDYSAIILDWKMPEMDGVETAREIRSKIGEEVPIIILSAFDYSEIEQAARDVGVNAFISKPLFRSRLLYVLHSLMDGGKQEITDLERLQNKEYTGKRVLLVEDNEINIEIANELLTEMGIEVDKAVNGRLAVERITEMPENYYDMVFMDIQMPEMNGYDATSAIRASEREDLRTVPIIAMSADVFMDDIKHAQSVGMNGHVAKPIEIGKLLKALEEWL